MKTTRPFSHDLNKIPNDYTVEVTNRFQGLDLIEDGGLGHCTRGSDQDNPHEKAMQKGQMDV